MIKTKKLPEHVLNGISLLSKRLQREENITALYLFGSAVKGYLNPLSDLDLAALLDKKIRQDKLFDEYLKIYDITSDILKTDEFDLIILNQAPLRFANNILRTGRLLFCKDTKQLSAFIEMNYKYFLDFKFYKQQFNKSFQHHLGIL